MSRNILFCAFAMLGACGTEKDAGPPVIACMKPGEFGTVTLVQSVPHRYHVPSGNDDIHVVVRTYVNFRMGNGASRICESSEGATALSQGDRISATEMALTNLGVVEGEPMVE